MNQPKNVCLCNTSQENVSLFVLGVFSEFNVGALCYHWVLQSFLVNY